MLHIIKKAINDFFHSKTKGICFVTFTMVLLFYFRRIKLSFSFFTLATAAASYNYLCGNNKILDKRTERKGEWPNDAFDVNIASDKKNEDLADELSVQLRNKGLRSFEHHRFIIPQKAFLNAKSFGPRFEECYKDIISATPCFLLVVSDDAKLSEALKEQLKQAFQVKDVKVGLILARYAMRGGSVEKEIQKMAQAHNREFSESDVFQGNDKLRRVYEWCKSTIPYSLPHETVNVMEAECRRLLDPEQQWPIDARDQLNAKLMHRAVSLACFKYLSTRLDLLPIVDPYHLVDQLRINTPLLLPQFSRSAQGFFAIMFYRFFETDHNNNNETMTEDQRMSRLNMLRLHMWYTTTPYNAIHSHHTTTYGWVLRGAINDQQYQLKSSNTSKNEVLACQCDNSKPFAARHEGRHLKSEGTFIELAENNYNETNIVAGQSYSVKAGVPHKSKVKDLNEQTATLFLFSHHLGRLNNGGGRLYRTSDGHPTDADLALQRNQPIPKRQEVLAEVKHLNYFIRPSFYRAPRSGKWFIIHNELESKISHEGALPLWDSFLAVHPNGIHTARDFIAIRLNDEQITNQINQIRLASYRWEKPRASSRGAAAIPSNYGWFLERVKNLEQIGWIDWVANVGCNVPVQETLDYMGQLYAEQSCTANWMFDPDQYLAEALSRGWIYQETAFGAFESSGIDCLLERVRSEGMKVRSCLENNDITTSVEIIINFIRLAENIGDLLSRRGWQDLATIRQFPVMTDYHMTPQKKIISTLGHDAMADLLVRRASGKTAADSIPTRGQGFSIESELRDEKNYPLNWDVLQKVKKNGMLKTKKRGMPLCHVLDFFTRPENEPLGKKVRAFMRELLIKRACDFVDTFEEFTVRFGFSMVSAYATSNVTYEDDRSKAITTVALAIAKNKFNLNFSAETLMRHMWVGAIRGAIVAKMPYFSIRPFNKAFDSSGHGFGLGQVFGTLLIGEKNGETAKYLTATNNFFQGDSLLGPCTSFYTYEKDGIWLDITGELSYQIVICSPPSELIASGATKLLIIYNICNSSIDQITVYLRGGNNKSEDWPSTATDQSFFS
jgi:hypothetical protein